MPALRVSVRNRAIFEVMGHFRPRHDHAARIWVALCEG